MHHVAVTERVLSGRYRLSVSWCEFLSLITALELWEHLCSVRLWRNFNYFLAESHCREMDNSCHQIRILLLTAGLFYLTTGCNCFQWLGLNLIFFLLVLMVTPSNFSLAIRLSLAETYFCLQEILTDFEEMYFSQYIQKSTHSTYRKELGCLSMLGKAFSGLHWNALIIRQNIHSAFSITDHQDGPLSNFNYQKTLIYMNK